MAISATRMLPATRPESWQHYVHQVGPAQHPPTSCCRVVVQSSKRAPSRCNKHTDTSKKHFNSPRAAVQPQHGCTS